MPGNTDAEQLEELNGIRERLMGQLGPLLLKRTTAKEHVLALYSFIAENQIQKKLLFYENIFRKEGKLSKAKEYAQIYRLVMELLDQIIGLLEDEPMEAKEFLDILDAGFSEIQVGTIPQDVDKVVVGDMERTRLNQIKALFFVGVNDGNIPKNSSKGGIISDIDREFLKEADFELAPTPRQQMYTQQLYLYMNMTKPTEKLFLSFARAGNDKKALRPSYLIEACRKLFPKTVIENLKKRPMQERIATRRDGIDSLAPMIRGYADDVLSAPERKHFFALYLSYLEEDKWKNLTEELTRTAFLSYKEKPLARAVAAALYG